MKSSEAKSSETWMPCIGDKVRRKTGGAPGEVTRLGPVTDWPGRGEARKVYWNWRGDIVWDWSFELEAW